MSPAGVHSLADDFLVRDELPEILESHSELAVFNRCLQRIHSPQRGPADPISIPGDSSAMAWADKLLLFLVPRDGATEMRTDRCEYPKLPLTIFRHINRFFGYSFAPAIHLFNLNGAHE